MTKENTLQSAAASLALGLGASGTAHATLMLVGGIAGNIPGAAIASEGLTPLGFGNPLGGYSGAQVPVGPGTLTF